MHSLIVLITSFILSSCSHNMITSKGKNHQTMAHHKEKQTKNQPSLNSGEFKNRQKFYHKKIENKIWILTNFEKNSNKYNPHITKNIRFQIKNGKISGSAGCNRFFSLIFQAKDSKPIISPALGITRKNCIGSIMNIESLFIDVLLKTTEFKTQSENLYALDSDGKTLMTFHLSNTP